ncbi:MAG: FG-GAP-like repeat-containing protein, partial [Balneolaceae bacterium]|nr:FG-GAP-like repeat-containing protein [Balneolaceae bacterium]
MKTRFFTAVFLLASVHTVQAQMVPDSISLTTNLNLAYPNWSPDGSRVAFMSDMLGEDFEIYVMNADGSNISRLTDNSRTDETPIWTHDSKQIIFASYPDDGMHDLYIMDSDGGNLRNLTHTPDIREDHPKLSPDGQRIIFNSDRDSNTPTPSGGAYDYEIYEMNLDSSDVRRLTNHPEWDTYPEISPDGSHIVWRRVLVQDNQRNSEIFLANRDGSNPVNLTDNPSFDGYPTWSPDGSKILFVSTRTGHGPNPRPRLFVMDSDGTNLSQITFPREEEADVRPWWAPDGRRIVFNRLSEGLSQFKIVHVSQAVHPIFFRPVRDIEPVTDDGSSRGVGWSDYDGDGYPDLLVANTMNGLNHGYRNNGNQSFTQITEDPIATSGKWSEGISWVDIENDGDPDLFVTNQWEGPNELFLNNGEGTFTLAGDTGDLTSAPSNSPGACWADYDLDGDLDVYVITRDGGNDTLFEHAEEGNFTTVTTGNISSNGGDGRSCAWGDLNGDSYPDLYVGNFTEPDGEGRRKARNFLYLNNAGNRFTEVTEGQHVTNRGVTYGVSLIDYDYDDDLDIFVTNIAGSDRNMLYENDGHGRFSTPRLTISAESNRPSKGHTWGDFNNDGHLDLFIANGTTQVEPEKNRNMLFLNNGEGDFYEIEDGPMVTAEGTSAGTAWSDMDRDGDLDLYIANWAENNEDNELYQNDITEGKNKNWIAFQLRGTKSNRNGLGTKLKIKAAIN